MTDTPTAARSVLSEDDLSALAEALRLLAEATNKTGIRFDVRWTNDNGGHYLLDTEPGPSSPADDAATVIGVALSALRGDPDGTATLLNSVPDNQIRGAALLALTGLTDGMRAVLTPEAMNDIVRSMQDLAAHNALEH